jgi:hypothetical protein
MRIKTVFIIVFFLFQIFSFNTRAQEIDSIFVQFSGVVVTADSLRPIPYVTISVEGTYRGTLTDLNGFFSFVARKDETLVFKCLGYKSVKYTIPDTLTKDRYSLIQMMRPDTLYLDTTFIYPWPTYEQFKNAFVKADIPDDELERARRNAEAIEEHSLTDYVPMDGSMNYRNYFDNYRAKLYYIGQQPPNNLLNPIAWYEFIKAWEEGKLKSKRKI